MGCGPKTIRLDRELESKVNVYCRKNNVSLNRLVNMAVDKFITQKHVIEMSPLDQEDLKEATNQGRSRKDRD